MQLASVGAMLPAGEAKRQLEGSQSLASSIVEEVRRLMRDLRPSLLDNLGRSPPSARLPIRSSTHRA